jgi:hypothetical protein
MRRKIKKSQPKKKFVMENFFFRKWLEKGEEIKYAVHMHPVIYHVKFSKIKFTYLLLPIILWFLFPQLKLVSMGLMLIGLWKITALAWNWYHQTWLITNKGVISIHASNFWHVNATRVEHSMVMGVTYDIKGSMGTLFNYGTIILEKPGESRVILKQAKNPLKAELAILKFKKRQMQEESQQNQSNFQEMLKEMTHIYAGARG